MSCGWDTWAHAEADYSYRATQDMQTAPIAVFFFYVESCMCLTIGTVVREASPGLWLSASLQTNQRNMTHFSMHPSWGVQVFIQPLLLGKSWAVIISVMLPLHACSQPSLALWLSPLCEKCLQWGKALNPFIPQFLHLWMFGEMNGRK